MVKQKRKTISEGAWKDLRVKKETANSLMYIKLENDLLTYDDAIQLLLPPQGFNASICSKLYPPSDLSAFPYQVSL